MLYSKNVSSSARITAAQRTNFFITCLLAACMLLLSAQINAASLINVDNRVSLSFSPMVVGQTAKAYSTDVVVSNISRADVLSPIRVVVTNIDQNNTSVSNADGITADGSPYIEIVLSTGVLAPGDSTTQASITFVREAGKSDPGNVANGKNKKAGFPVFDFETSVLGGSAIAPLAPGALPYVLTPDSGAIDVVFKINVLTEGNAVVADILLRNLTLGGDVLTNDAGSNGDVAAADGIYGTTVSVNTDAMNSGDCLTYVSATLVDGLEVVSSEFDLCATSFPTRVDASDTSEDNQITFNGGSAVADEILIFVSDDMTEDDINKILKEIGGEVTGTALISGMYQIRLSEPLTETELARLIAKLESRDGIESAGANYIGAFDFTPDDTQYPVQHALQLMPADDVWDANATGSGITITLLDSGVEDSHPDFINTDASSQILPAPVAGGNTDTLGHGTEMAGIMAAATNNALGVAAIAKDVNVESIKISVDASVTQAEMLQGFNDANMFGTGSVVNASFSIFGPLLPTPGLCGSIDTVIAGGAVVVNSAGNDNNSTTGVWPGMCNDPALDGLLNTQLPGDIISPANKDSFIVVAASNCSAGVCAADTKKADSNFGTWVDVAAPGVNVQSTTIGGAYTTSQGTSAAAAITSGASAILRDCGVASTSVQSVLQTGATVAVTADFNRINIYDSLVTQNTSPTGLQLDGGIAVALNENINTAGGIAVGILTTLDTTGCDTHAYAITGGTDAISFTIVGNQLMLDDGNLNFENRPGYTVNVQSTDFYTSSTGSQTFTVNINDLNDAPAFTSSNSASIPENTSPVLALTASDEDVPADILSYSVTGGVDAAQFTVVGNQLSFVAAPDFEAPADSGADNVYNVSVSVSDGTVATPMDITVTVTDVVEGAPIPDPILVFNGTFVDYLDAFGDPFRRWHFDVTNWASYPAELFASTSDFGPCGLNPTPARAWVDFYRASDNSRIFGFCDLGTPENLNGIWFAMPAGTPPPVGGVYITITDRAPGGLVYTSNVVSDAVLPFP